MNRIRKITITSLLLVAFLFGASFGAVTAYADTATVYSGSGVSVNMRSGAGTDYDRVCSIPDGATVEIGALTDGWYEVSYNGYSGYVLADLVQTGSSSVSNTTESQETTSESTYESEETQTASSEETAETSSEEGDIVINGESYTVDNDFYADEMPDGFSYTAVLINGEDTNAAYSDELELYLVHLISSDGTEGWFVHDENVSDYFYPYITVGSGDNYLIVKQTDEEAVDGYSKVSFPLDAFGIIYGFQEDGGLAEHYIVYGMTNLGDEGWFIVDTSTASYISSNGMTAVETEDEETETAVTDSSNDNEVFFKRLCAGLGLLSVVLLVLLIAALIKGRRGAEDFDDDEDYDEDDYISYDDDFGKYDEEEEDIPLPLDIDLDIVNEAKAEEPAGRYANQLKKEEEISESKAQIAEARHRAYSDISAADRPDNIDIIDLN